MADVYYEVGKYKLSTESYFRGMEKLDDKEILDYLFDEQKILLSSAEKKEFAAAPYDKKKRLFKKFWKRRDPDPSTVKNERLMEHFRRVKYAREFFHFTAPPYYDDRGKIYIKYGAPDDRYNSSLGSIPAKDNESWSYENIEKGLVFDFVADGAYYRLVEDLTEAALPGYGYNQRLYLASSLYQDRSHLSPTYSALSAHFSKDKLFDYHAVRTEALTKYPDEVFIPARQIIVFPFITRWAQFKDKDKKTRIEFYTSFPGLALKTDPLNTNLSRHVDFFVEVNDTNFNSIVKEQKRFSYQLNSNTKIQNRQFMFQNNYLVTPGKYSVAMVLENVEASEKGVQRKELIVIDFSSDKLMLSGLQLSSNIEAKTDDSNEIFVKNGLTIAPYTFRRVMRSNPIFIYFEIYNLAPDNQGLTNYEVAYSVETIKPQRNLWQKTLGRIFSSKKKSIISTSTRMEGDSRDTFEYIAFDLNNLEKGLTDLRVKITDQNSSQVVDGVVQMLLID